ncbi:gp454 [Bacillus phage G]|uniref:Gp454 n=1 Tax=Bacillus phage G TaxID=2884420 RepID=G3MAJ5_9CAUD|nr:gp454 [Bacillus phage G]AEO93712.1 gp454 [Bacillus phage G]
MIYENVYKLDWLEFGASVDEIEKFNDIVSVSDTIKVKKVERNSELRFYLVEASNIEKTIEFVIKISENNVIVSIDDTKPFDYDEKIRHFDSTIIAVLSNIADSLFLAKNKEIKKKIDIIHCIDNLCPICGNEIKKGIEKEMLNRFDSLTCKNGCYVVDFRNFNFEHQSTVVSVTFFRKNKISSKLLSSLSRRMITIDQIYASIQWWKSNDRYLAKILTESDGK